MPRKKGGRTPRVTVNVPLPLYEAIRELVEDCSFPLLFRILNRLGGFCLLQWKFPVERLDWCFEGFDV